MSAALPNNEPCKSIQHLIKKAADVSHALHPVKMNTVVFFGLFSVLMIALSIIGTVRAYSAVPFWDMWNGYLGFYVNATAGDWHAWWVQHNEHRVLLSRLLFWVDLHYFRGLSIFLLIMNFVLMALAAALFCRWLDHHISSKNNRIEFTSLSAIMIGTLFFWSQQNNITWGFQSQFFLAQLLPLAALYCLYRASSCVNSFFYLSCGLGALSAGTMANGVLILPLMVIYSLLTKSTWQRTLALALLCVATSYLYFQDYHSVVGHGSLKDAIFQKPLQFLSYILIYVGSPFYYIGPSKSLVVAGVAGLGLVTIAGYHLWVGMQNAEKHRSQLALVLFILYVGGTAFGTAGGRLSFGLETAISSRYTTPAIMAWLAALLLMTPIISNALRKGSSLPACSLMALCGLMIPYQLSALDDHMDEVYNRKVAALALELRIEDQLQVGVIFPSAKWALEESLVPHERNLSIFGTPDIKDLEEQIGSTYSMGQTDNCLGHIDVVERIEDERFVRVKGWLWNSTAQAAPPVIVFINESGKIAGFGLTGDPRPDVTAAIDSEAGRSGFKGYIGIDQVGKPVTVVGRDSCKLHGLVPALP